MSFKELYDFAQTQEIHVNRNVLKAEVIRLTGVDDIKFIRSGLDTTVCRGYWLTPENKDHPLVRQLGCHIVVTAREMNRCWDRFVTVKEMMHIFDSENQKTKNVEEFEDLLLEFSSGMADTSEQMLSEFASFWRALSVLCPAAKRAEFAKQRAASEIDNYGIALQLKIPEQYVPRLFEKRYDRWLADNL